MLHCSSLSLALLGGTAATPASYEEPTQLPICLTSPSAHDFVTQAVLHGDELLRRSRHASIQLVLHNGQATCVIFLSLMQEAVEMGHDAPVWRMRAALHAPNHTKAIAKTAMFGIVHQGIFKGTTKKSIKIGLHPVTNLRVRTY